MTRATAGGVGLRGRRRGGGLLKAEPKDSRGTVRGDRGRGAWWVRCRKTPVGGGGDARKTCWGGSMSSDGSGGDGRGVRW